MATWNHRVIVNREGSEDHYQIHEVHYDDEGKIEAWTENAVRVGEDSKDELRMTLHRMLRALSKPILMEKDGKLVPYEPRERSDLKRTR